MLELTMAAFRPDAIPAVGLQGLDDFTNLHTFTRREKMGVGEKKEADPFSFSVLGTLLGAWLLVAECVAQRLAGLGVGT